MNQAIQTPAKNMAVHQITALNHNWQFRQAGQDNWLPAEVPGCVHTDLLRQGQIEDPFYRDNETKLQWIGTSDWEYRLFFEINPAFLNFHNIELILKGLDTYAEVYLNHQKMLDSDNMFREFHLDCKALLKPGQNELLVRFRSPINEIFPGLAEKPFPLPASNDRGEGTSPYTRKAPYHFGWDWGPRFVTCGIWRSISLDCWNDCKITDLFITTNELSDSEAKLTAELTIVADAEQQVLIELQDITKQAFQIKKEVQLKPGVNKLQFNVQIENPERWWPNGLGEQFMYRIQASLWQNNNEIDRFQRKVGIRTIELSQQPDQWGKNFTFVVNGVPLFAKGGNWIPADNFVTRISDEKYETLLGACRDVHINMIRVWGGGIYEADIFYELCDQLGLLVWQDFMFACSFYPADPAFLENVEKEAQDQLVRLRNHPSIALWCGNNEIEAGWSEWGWKERLPELAFEDYKKLFHELLPRACGQSDPSRPYWPSSPSSNLLETASSQTSGDIHYWDVWHGSRPFSEYKQQFPRFISEFGFQSFPKPETIRKFSIQEDHKIDSPVMLAHQKNNRGNKLIEEYMLRDYHPPKDFLSFAILSQIVQAEGLKIGIEHFRRLRPRCMGTLYWQIDDCWPVASWASLDYFGSWKALHYFAKKFYNDILISPDLDGDRINIHLVSDKQATTKGQVNLQLCDFSGKILFAESESITLPGASSQTVITISRAEILTGQNPASMVLWCEFVQGKQVLSQNQLYFVPPKDLQLAPPQIKARLESIPSGVRIRLATDKLARNVYLSIGEISGFFTDNFFDLFPQKDVVLDFQTSLPLTIEDFQSKLKIQSLYDLISEKFI